MNKTRIVSTLILATVVALSASCGSNDGDSSRTSGNGGTPSAGGASSANGGTTVSGGSIASGGTSQASSSDVSPKGGTQASSSSQSEGGTAAGGKSGTADSTNSAGASPYSCPTNKPTEGDTCSRAITASRACTYDDGGCLCVDKKWSCYAKSDCPDPAPANKDTCTLNLMSCSYGDLRCSCSTDNGWNCATPCPESRPADQATCTRASESTCRYGDDDKLSGGFGSAATTCACNSNAFTCFTKDSCPEQAPENASACTMTTLACSYDDRQCSCGTDGTWKCVTDCPEATPEAGSACVRDQKSVCYYTDDALVNTIGDVPCVCTDEKFTCYKAADCPSAAPSTDGECTLLGLNCQYDDDKTTCRCRTSTSKWSCSTSTRPDGTAGAPGVGGSSASSGGSSASSGGSSASSGGSSASSSSGT